MNEELRKAQKEEAIRRLGMLNLHPDILAGIKADEKVLYYSDPIGVLYWVKNNPEWQEKIEQFEEEYEAYVYHCIFSRAPFGDCLTLLYVSKYQEEEWQMDKEDLEEGYPMSYVFNLDDDMCSEFGRVPVKERWGGLIRLDV